MTKPAKKITLCVSCGSDELFEDFLCLRCFNKKPRSNKLKKKISYLKGLERHRLKGFRKDLLAKPTKSQDAAYETVLRISSYFGIAIKPECIVKPYIIDIYIPALRVGIEIDGSVHNNREAYDDKRDSYLKNKNITIVRFTNDQVKTEYFKQSVWALFYQNHANRTEIINRASEKEGISSYV